MFPAGVLTALGAALAFGVYLYIYKRSFDDLPATVYLAVVEIAGLCWYLPIAALTWPAETAVVPDSLVLADLVLLAGLGVAVSGANLVSIRAFKLGDVSYVAPLNKLVPVFVLPVELLVLSVDLGWLQMVGVGVAGVAIYIANYDHGAVLAPVRRATTYRPAQLALVGAVLFAFNDVGIRAVLSTTPLAPQTVALFTFTAVALAALPLALQRADWQQLRPALPGLVTLAGLFAVGVHLVTISFARAPASVVSPLVNTQAVVAVLLGSVLLSEGQLRRRLSAAVLAVAGVALVAAG